MVATQKIADLRGLKHMSSIFSQLEDDYIVCQFTADMRHLGSEGVLSAPTKVAGLSLCLIKEGSLTMEIDTKPYRLEKDSLAVFGASSVIRVAATDSPTMVCDFLFVSTQFIQDINFDLNAINLHSLVENRPSPIMPVSHQEADTICTFLKLLYINARDNSELIFAKNVGRSLLQALLYQLLQLRSNHEKSPAMIEGENAPNRQLQYVHEFMRLLQIHHSAQRSIAFYAKRLCISSKYLSHLVKDATGRSASDWIAEVVVQEAKNMLRFSNKNVQQVAYALNFSTQSSFGKYFKHVTGISPSEYQKS